MSKTRLKKQRQNPTLSYGHKTNVDLSIRATQKLTLDQQIYRTLIWRQNLTLSSG